MAMAQGNGAFVVAELCRQVNTGGTDEDKKLLRTWFTQEGVSDEVRSKEIRGKNILLESIDALLST